MNILDLINALTKRAEAAQPEAPIVGRAVANKFFPTEPAPLFSQMSAAQMAAPKAPTGISQATINSANEVAAATAPPAPPQYANPYGITPLGMGLDPRESFSMKMGKRELMDPALLKKARDIMEQNPMPGMQDLKSRESELRNYIDLMRAEEQQAKKNSGITETDFSNLANFANLAAGNQNLKYTAPKPYSKELMATRTALEKELSNAIERRSQEETKQFKDLFEPPSYTTQTINQDKNAGKDQKLPPGLASHKWLEVSRKNGDVVSALDRYIKLAKERSDEKGYAMKWGQLDPELEAAYGQLQILAKEAANMGANLAGNELEILTRTLPSFGASSILKPAKKAEKLKILQDARARIVAQNDNIKDRLKGAFPGYDARIDSLAKSIYEPLPGSEKKEINTPEQAKALQQYLDFNNANYLNTISELKGGQ